MHTHTHRTEQNRTKRVARQTDRQTRKDKDWTGGGEYPLIATNPTSHSTILGPLITTQHHSGLLPPVVISGASRLPFAHEVVWVTHLFTVIPHVVSLSRGRRVSPQFTCLSSL